MIRFTTFIFAILLFASTGLAQVGSGTLKGKISDFDTGEPLPFASVVLFLNGNQVAGTNTNFDGEFEWAGDLWDLEASQHIIPRYIRSMRKEEETLEELALRLS